MSDEEIQRLVRIASNAAFERTLALTMAYMDLVRTLQDAGALNTPRLVELLGQSMGIAKGAETDEDSANLGSDMLRMVRNAIDAYGKPNG